MIKLGEFWLNVEKVNMAVVDKHGTLTVYFSKDASVKIDGNVRPDEVKRIVACLDAASGYTPSAKESENEVVTFSGVDCEGRAWLGPLPEDRPVKAKTGLEKIREMSPAELADMLVNAPCPPVFKDCEREDCEACWTKYLQGPADGDPHA